MISSLENRIVLVTGSNRGIGREIAERALELGAAKVYAAARDPESVKDLAQKWGERLVPIKIDLLDPQSIESAAGQANDVDIVVNNAGVLKTASPLSVDAFEALEFETKVNVYGLIRMAQAFAPVLKTNGNGVFVQLNSVASLRSFADFGTYSASKAASYSITQGLRDLLAEQGTQVISVHPGPIATDMADSAGLGEVAESPVLVADGIFEAIQNKEFHVFPDSMAKQIWHAYETFAKGVVESPISEGVEN